jgi:biopolymer transport protein ExbD
MELKLAEQVKKIGGLKRKSSAGGEIPLCSTADIAFLLLIFFMVSTVFRKETPLKITVPEASALKKTQFQNKNIVHIWINKDDERTPAVNEAGWVYVDDVPYDLTDPARQSALIEKLRGEAIERKGKILLAVRADRNLPYSKLDAVLELFKQANTVQIMFATILEQQVLDLRR